jgi:hypothetical protein
MKSLLAKSDVSAIMGLLNMVYDCLEKKYFNPFVSSIYLCQLLGSREMD